MGAYTAWLSCAPSAAPPDVDPARTVLVSDYEPGRADLARLLGAIPHVLVLPADPERPLPGVAYYRYQTFTNPLRWGAAVDDAFRRGADTVAFLLPPHEVRGQTLLRLRGLGVRRVLLPEGGRLRSHSPWLLALWRRMATLGGRALRTLGAADPDRITEAAARSVFDQAPPRERPAGGPLRVAHFVTSLNSGGAERQVCNAAVGQNRDGLDVRVLTRFSLVGDD